MSLNTPISSDSVRTPTCFYHSDILTNIRCQRCDRYVCVKCQKNAFVGIQCFDCVDKYKKNLLKQKTIFGGLKNSNESFVTKILIAICVVFFVLQYLDSFNLVQNFIYAPFLTESQPWRMVTANFLHSQNFILHLFLNMFMLFILGKDLERFLGRTRFLSLYLISGFSGSVMVLLLAQPNSNSWFQPVLGASGAVYGLLGALYVVQRSLRMDTKQITMLILMNLVFSVVIPNISWQAHLGGLLTGVALSLVITRFSGEKRNFKHFIGFIIIVFLLILLTFFKILVA